MKLMINGKPYEYAGDNSLLQLLANMDAIPEQVAVMLNESVIKKTEYATTRLNDGDAVEIMMMVGGGA